MFMLGAEASPPRVQAIGVQVSGGARGWTTALGIGGRTGALVAVALFVSLISLGANGYLLWRLRDVEERALDRARRAIDRFEREDVRIPYRVSLPVGTPLRLDIPVDEKLRVRLNTQLPIDTRIQVPLRTPWGVHAASLPIRTTIPIRTEIPLRIRHTFRLRTRTQDEIVVPLEVRVRDLPLDALRESLEP